MKTRLLSLLALVLLATSASFAEVKDVETVTPAAEFLQKNIKYPIVAREQNISGSVLLAFRADEGKKLVLETLGYDHKLLSDGVLAQIKRVETKLLDLMDPDVPQVFKLTFESR